VVVVIVVAPIVTVAMAAVVAAMAAVLASVFAANLAAVLAAVVGRRAGGVDGVPLGQRDGLGKAEAAEQEDGSQQQARTFHGFLSPAQAE
jgi:hypothetical protein